MKRDYSSFLTTNVVASVVEKVLPLALQAAHAIGDPTKRKFYIVVALENGARDGAPFADCIVYQSKYNFADDLTNPYDRIAINKAELSWTYKVSSHRMVTEMPQLAQNGDMKWQGGAYYRGIAVGVSGLQAPVDEMVAMWVATALIAQAQLMMKELVASDTSFFG